MMISDINVGDRVDVSNWGSFLVSGYGPLATITKIIFDLELKPRYFHLRVDEFPYEDEDEDGNFDEDSHTISANQFKLYIRTIEFQYQPSQEGDKEDDI
jgi:hypothetical protein